MGRRLSEQKCEWLQLCNLANNGRPKLLAKGRGFVDVTLRIYHPKWINFSVITGSPVLWTRYKNVIFRSIVLINRDKTIGTNIPSLRPNPVWLFVLILREIGTSDAKDKVLFIQYAFSLLISEVKMSSWLISILYFWKVATKWMVVAARMEIPGPGRFTLPRVSNRNHPHTQCIFKQPWHRMT